MERDTHRGQTKKVLEVRIRPFLVVADRIVIRTLQVNVELPSSSSVKKQYAYVNVGLENDLRKESNEKL